MELHSGRPNSGLMESSSLLLLMMCAIVLWKNTVIILYFKRSLLFEGCVYYVDNFLEIQSHSYILFIKIEK